MQVSFIIPVYNQVEYTRACLRSIEEHVGNRIEHEVILVDDGSDEATKAFLADLAGAATVVTLEKNLGFARATNIGAKRAIAAWLCLLNNDVELTAGAMEEMLEVASRHPDAGIVGNVQVYTDSGEVDHAGIGFVDRGYPVHLRPPLADVRNREAATPAIAVTAACCLIRCDWFLNVGGLDSRYRNGFEDIDLCLRAREAGWKIYVANRSVVRHAVSASEGRGTYEYRNALKFLERWGPRTAALEHADEKAQAAEFRQSRAKVMSEGLPGVITSARKQAQRTAANQVEFDQRPATIWVDLLRMEPRGANGGIKPLVYQLLREIGRRDDAAMVFVVLAQESLREELDFLHAEDVIALKTAGAWQVIQGGTTKGLTLEQLSEQFTPEALYSPFGTSVFAREGLPQVALLVDALHRDLPSALPIEEVNFREDNFKRVIAEADWLQTLAEHGTERLGHHFGVHPTRCFHTYAAVQDRLSTAEVSPTRPARLPSRPFFFYPANFWPHKNHEVLLAAYGIYLSEVGESAWPLLLTGHPDDRMELLKTQRDALGLQENVDFAGHLPDDAFKAVWQFAGALVFPSLHEGFGIPVVEAFAAGLPVIASRCSVMPEVGGEACAWIDPRDPRDLAETLAKIAARDDWRDELVQKGHQRLERFSLRFEAAKLHHFLHSAAKGRIP